jgi:hypothetical protein
MHTDTISHLRLSASIGGEACSSLLAPLRRGPTQADVTGARPIAVSGLRICSNETPTP